MKESIGEGIVLFLTDPCWPEARDRSFRAWFPPPRTTQPESLATGDDEDLRLCGLVDGFPYWSGEYDSAHVDARDVMADPLTGLLGMVELLSRAADLAESSSVLSAAVINIDDSKRNNAVLGHLRGDAIITEVGQRVRSVMEPHGLVGRVGGDEFLAVLPDIPAKTVTTLAQELSDLVAATPVSSSSEPYVISAEEITKVQGYGQFYGPLTDGTYAVAAHRTRVQGLGRAATPSAGLQVTAAFASVTIGVATTAGADLKDLVQAAEMAMCEGKNSRDGVVRSVFV